METPGDVKRYQIDYILVKQTFKNQVKDCRTCPSPDIDSNQSLVISESDLI